MTFKKASGKIFGVGFTEKESKALDAEINRQIAEKCREFEDELNGLILWQLHVQLGFGKKRLKRFYDNFSKVTESFMGQYKDGYFSHGKDCIHKLGEIGINIEDWKKGE